MIDLYSEVKITPAIAPQVGTDDTAFVSAVIDTANYAHNVFAITLGTLSDANATATVLLEHADESGFGDNEAVSDDEMLGTEAAAAFRYDDDGETRKIGYIGAKRYIRLTITPSGNTGNIPIAAVCIQAGARVQPVA